MFPTLFSTQMVLQIFNILCTFEVTIIQLMYLFQLYYPTQSQSCFLLGFPQSWKNDFLSTYKIWIVLTCFTTSLHGIL